MPYPQIWPPVLGAPQTMKRLLVNEFTGLICTAAAAFIKQGSTPGVAVTPGYIRL